MELIFWDGLPQLAPKSWSSGCPAEAERGLMVYTDRKAIGGSTAAGHRSIKGTAANGQNRQIISPCARPKYAFPPRVNRPHSAEDPVQIGQANAFPDKPIHGRQ